MGSEVTKTSDLLFIIYLTGLKGQDAHPLVPLPK